MEALDSIQRAGGGIDLLLTDVRMPRMDGISLAQAVAKIYPQVPVLFISGYPLDIGAEKDKHPSKACGYVQKPFLPKSLLEAVRNCIEPSLNKPKARPAASH